jgi:lipoprotein-anchoring transpeptidase ErfK/SrfK
MRTTSPGQIMTQSSAQTHQPMRWRRLGVFNVIVVAGALSVAPFISLDRAGAQTLGYAPAPQAVFPSDERVITPGDSVPSDGGATYALPERLRRAVVALDTAEAPGTIIIDTGNTTLYYVLDRGRAIRYGVGVGRDGFTWSGIQTITHKAEWPDWHPPAQMIVRQPYLPRFMAGGPGNPLGARAMYLGSSDYRIHGTNDPTTIGKFVSSGCIRLTNEDVTDLFNRVGVGTRVVVLAKNATHLAARPIAGGDVAAARTHPVVTQLPSGRQAMNLSTSQSY